MEGESCRRHSSHPSAQTLERGCLDNANAKSSIYFARSVAFLEADWTIAAPGSVDGCQDDKTPALSKSGHKIGWLMRPLCTRRQDAAFGGTEKHVASF